MIAVRMRDYLRMKVRELLARLQDADPDFVIVIDAASQSLLILNPKPGFCHPTEIEDDDRSADAGLPSRMKVRELLARLQDADPDFVIAIDAASQSLQILNPKPGFCHPTEIEEYETACLTEQDLEFLRDIHIKQ